MQISQIKLIKGLLAVEQTPDEVETESGIVLSENTDDFLVHAEVINSSSKLYSVGTMVVYHVLDAETFRDGAKAYALLREEKIKGTYGTD